MKEATKSPNDPEEEKKKTKKKEREKKKEKKSITRFQFVESIYVDGINQMVPPAKWAMVSGHPAAVKVRLVYSYVPK